MHIHQFLEDDVWKLVCVTIDDEPWCLADVEVTLYLALSYQMLYSSSDIGLPWFWFLFPPHCRWELKCEQSHLRDTKLKVAECVLKSDSVLSVQGFQ